ncbi:MAG: hypothetical protein HC799_18610 [Limnothrix sp. RL_2_0]|nr:hypothetical protein [Limnothrix sp. RL_2_0]
MHIPKTAGTSLNNFLASHFTRDEYVLHMESNNEWRDQKLAILRKKKFISGHIRFPDILKKNLHEERLKIITLRNPIDHLASHISWVRHLSLPGNEKRLHQHTHEIQDISTKLSVLDFSNYKQVSGFFNNMSAAEETF